MASHEFAKWRTTIASSLARQMTYKVDFFLMLIAPSIVFVSVNYTVWRSIFTLRGDAPIGGFSMDEMLRYQCWSLIAAFLIRSHRSWDLSEDIRMGRITAFLLYPFDLWKFHACEFLAFQCVQIVMAAIAIITMITIGLLPLPPLACLMTGVFFSLCVSALWFLFEFAFGLVAFWLEETWILRFVFNLFAVLLSGAFIPIELFPQSLQAILRYTPFPLIASLPVHLFLGSNVTPLPFAFLSMAIWMAIMTLASIITWRRGIGLYSAAGM